MDQRLESFAGVRPLFLLSLPRAGSTMLQRMLAAHPAVATTAEPWVLLPYLYTMRETGVLSDFGHGLMHRAVRTFCASLPGGEEEYLRQVGEFVSRLYAGASPAGAKYFLDKTPRYTLVADLILRAFPAVPVIVLWRNPLAVIASISSCWGKHGWVYGNAHDLYEGLSLLIEVYRQQPQRFIALRFEDLVLDPEPTLNRVFDALGLERKPEVIEQFASVELAGRMGDPTGRRLYGSLSPEPLEKWKQDLAGPVRKWWCRRYLRWLGRDRLAVMGYDLDALIAELDAVPVKWGSAVGDIVRMVLGSFRYRMRRWVFSWEYRRLRKRQAAAGIQKAGK